MGRRRHFQTMSSNLPTPSSSPTNIPLDATGKPLKPCCACPDTRLKRDQCILMYGEEMCADLIEEHKECLRKLGFAV
ncbi:unnamed protein product [Heterobilharzia americana]|nr:unnamed protein product [Heterobilharzia americana]